MGGVQDVGQDAARTVRASRAYQILVKVGLVSYGIVHLLVSWVALRLALGERGGAQASNEGALQTMASTPLGAGLMWVVAAGLGTLVVWQLVRILIGFREFEEAKRWRKRASAVLRALIYGSLAAASASIAVGAQRPGGDSKETLSAQLLAMPGGTLLVGAVGLAVIGYGVYQVVKAVRNKFNEDLEVPLDGVPERLAQAGFVAKGLSLGIVGGLFLWAAATLDPAKAGGLDQALRLVLERPFGPWLLGALAVGLGAYGVYCFFWATWAKNA